MPGVTTDRATAARTALAALGGLLAAFAALAFAELAAAAARPEAGPLTAVGGSAIDRTPAPVKDWAIRTFGEDDKLVLRLGIVAVLALFAVALGVLALRRRRTAAAGVLVFGIVGAAAAMSRPDATGAADALPSLAGALAGAGVLYVLAGRLTAHRAAVPAGPADGDAPGPGPAPDAPAAGPAPDAPAAVAGPAADPAPAPDPIGWDRRGFLVAAGVAAAASAGAGALGRVAASARGQDAVASRSAVVLPRPASPAAPVPAGAALRIRDLTPFVTPNKDFYRVDTALVVPRVDATRWRLRIHGRGVRTPLTVTYRDLLDSELIERDITLTCVSNEVGGPYAGNARWIGVRLAELLERAGVRPPSRGGPADQLVARSVDGMTLGTPVEDVMDGRDALLAVGMNGEPLPFDHGFPVRMVVPGLYGYVSACKWIEDLELTTFDAYDPYWVKRKWARRAPVKTQSRIDTPKPFARPAAGTVTVAGVAWAQHRGIRKVEIRVDDGPWQPADLAAEHTADTWRQWSYPWRAVPGTHTLTVRATDGTGETQTAARTRTVPDGAGGRHSVVVTVD
ncbi:molybdopterin-dependent oxidoreductase [Streptomyces sp. NPDC005805]|uniref:molybdopterin-dependent oxidoreductase n=1 Tax=Streptomyces sp. NPDC005805 TaxID=3157068 RepID=UPI0033F2C1FC